MAVETLIYFLLVWSTLLHESLAHHDDPCLRFKDKSMAPPQMNKINADGNGHGDKSYEVFRDIVYDSDASRFPDQKMLDIYVPREGKLNMPVLLFVHGGGWTMGDKSRVQYKPAFFTAHDIIFVSANYRLSDRSYGRGDHRSGIFPMHAEDIVKAISWIRNHIHAYRGNAQQIMLMGHSAGANIVNIIGTNPRLLDKENLHPADLSAIISLDCGVLDVHYELSNSRGRFRKGLLLDAFGRDSSRYDAASPLKQDFRTGDCPSFMLVYQDTRKKRYQHRLLKHALAGSGTRAVMWPTNAYSHTEINRLIGSDRDHAGLSKAIISFIRSVTGKD